VINVEDSTVVVDTLLPAWLLTQSHTTLKPPQDTDRLLTALLYHYKN